MSRFTIDTKAEAAITPDGRLQRPWKVFGVGMLLSAGLLAISFLRMRSTALLNDNALRCVVGFAVWALLMTSAYAYLGARHSKARADRVIGWAGLIVALVGTALVLWAMLMPPRYM